MKFIQINVKYLFKTEKKYSNFETKANKIYVAMVIFMKLNRNSFVVIRLFKLVA